MSGDRRRSALAAMIMCVSLAGATTDAIAQTSSSTEQLAFDRPEAWAMKYFTSATALSGLDTPDRLNPGSLAIQCESGWLTTLSAAQEQVGFNGITAEDLNKAPVFLRPRVAIGLHPRLIRCSMRAHSSATG